MKRTILIVVGLTLVVLLLAGGAYVAGKLLGRVGQEAGAITGPRVILPSGSGSDASSVTLKLEPAEEVPDRRYDALGIFVRRQDNRIFLREATGSLMITMSDDGTIATNAEGNELEVVVTSETIVYCDVTSYDGSLAEDGTLKQRLLPGSLEEIGEFSALSVWGERRGDRIVAEVLLYRRPPVVQG